MTEYKFQTWDVFTQQKFAGNPLGVVFDAQGLSTGEMQTITREFNLSETTFILPPENPANTARVRIFTLGYEMPFAGHPTVGTAIAIAKARGLSGILKLELNAGLFAVDVEVSGETARAQFTNPNIPVEIGGVPTADALATALGINVADIDMGDHRPRFCGSGGVNYVYVRASLEAVQRATLNASAYSVMGLSETVGVYLYAKGGVSDDASWHARMFAPDAGIPEDPATGSAAAGFPAQIAFSEILPDGTHSWLIEQGFEMERPSQILAEVDIRDSKIICVRIGGYAVPVMAGTLKL